VENAFVVFALNQTPWTV